MRLSFLLLLLLFLVGVNDVEGASEFRVCAFNLHHFGESKTRKDAVMLTLSKVGFLDYIFTAGTRNCFRNCIVPQQESRL